MKDETPAQSDSYWIVKVYPFAILVMASALNACFGISTMTVAIPSTGLLALLSCSAIMLVINHSWIMTVTELTRNRYKVYASPEEWLTKGCKKRDVSEKGMFEIERCLNTHRNTTENSVYYILLVFVFLLISPSQIAAWGWILLFPLARLGYTYSYFSGNDNTRGLFMSLSLLSLYGMASYLALGLL